MSDFWPSNPNRSDRSLVGPFLSRHRRAGGREASARVIPTCAIRPPAFLCSCTTAPGRTPANWRSRSRLATQRWGRIRPNHDPAGRHAVRASHGLDPARARRVSRAIRRCRLERVAGEPIIRRRHERHDRPPWNWRPPTLANGESAAWSRALARSAPRQIELEAKTRGDLWFGSHAATGAGTSGRDRMLPSTLCAIRSLPASCPPGGIGWSREHAFDGIRQRSAVRGHSWTT